MLNRIILTFAFTWLVVPISFARFASNLNDDYLLMTVINETPHNCELDDAHAIKGTDLTVLRPILPSGHTADFIDLHVWTNAHYLIAYRCGDATHGYKRVAFESKRNFGFWWAGYTRGRFLPEESSPGITAVITKKRRGSTTVLHLNGYIDWSIRYTQEG